jgi:hypothetical protein
MPRCFLSYEELLRDWRRQVERICQQTGVVLPNGFDNADTAVHEFLTEELYHERASTDETQYDGEVSQLARDTYRVFLEICARGESKELLDRLDNARAAFDEHCRSAAAMTSAEDLAPSQ